MRIIPLILPSLTAAALRGHDPSQNASPPPAKVSLQVYSESGCPNCQSLVAGDLNKTLTAEGVIDILDFDFVSFGNAYYLQSECPGYPNYDRTDGVACYQKKCGVQSPPAECFEGTIACQHGDIECAGNVLQSCVKDVVDSDVRAYMDFNYCFEAAYSSPNAGELCASAVGISWNNVSSCVEDPERVQHLMTKAARKTVKQLIPGE